MPGRRLGVGAPYEGHGAGGAREGGEALLAVVAERPRAQTRDVAGEAVGGRAQGERREARLEERTRAEESAYLLDALGLGVEAGRLGRMDAAAESEARDARAALVEHVGEVGEHAVGACLLGGRGVCRAVVEHGVPFVLPVGLGRGAVLPFDGAERTHVVAAVRGEHVEPLDAAEPNELVVERQVAHADPAHQHSARKGCSRADAARSKARGSGYLDSGGRTPRCSRARRTCRAARRTAGHASS